MAFIFFLIIKVVENIFDNMATMDILHNEASDILSASGVFFGGGGFFPFNLFFLNLLHRFLKNIYLKGYSLSLKQPNRQKQKKSRTLFS